MFLVMNHLTVGILFLVNLFLLRPRQVPAIGFYVRVLMLLDRAPGVTPRTTTMSKWRDDLATFLPRDLLEAAVDTNVKVRPPITGARYFAFADPSGGSHDSFALAIAHREPNGTVVLDLLYERHAPFNPSEVVAEIAALLKAYHCSTTSTRQSG
jgi:hypothetical protein